MAVKMNLSTSSLLALFTSLGLDTDLVFDLLSKGVKVGVVKESIVFSTPTVSGKTIEFTVGPYQPGVLSLAQKGSLGSYAKKMLGVDIQAKVNLVLYKIGQKEALASESNDKVPPSVESVPKEEVLLAIESNEGVLNQVLSELKVDSVAGKVVIPSIGGKNLDSISKLMSKAPVKLGKAVELYQPVKGTSDASCYFVVAFTSMVAIAARMLDSKISIRVEPRVGVSPEKLDSEMTTLGFVKSGNNPTVHWSIHFHVEQIPNLSFGVAAKRALGSVVMSVPGTLEKVISSVVPLLEKGV
jgi:hypothetical protein